MNILIENNNLEIFKHSRLLKNILNRNEVGEESYDVNKINVNANSTIRSFYKDIWKLKYVNLKMYT